MDKITKTIEQKKYTIGIFLDLSKAFDTVDHNILLSKLEHYGIRGIALEWFKNYLHDSHQIVKYKKTLSKSETVKRGVPQGSVLEPRGGGRYSIYPWVGRCDAASHTLTLFKTNIADFLKIVFLYDGCYAVPLLYISSIILYHLFIG